MFGDDDSDADKNYIPEPEASNASSDNLSTGSSQIPEEVLGPLDDLPVNVIPPPPQRGKTSKESVNVAAGTS
ncbi:hypothetical protein J6590_059005 [Homalodisca vitripennis]|nr:hypothetical protein J6590_059005 [Homalodisca vitripennis]